MNPPQRLELKPGYYFSPGFYVDFWTNYVEKQFSEKVRLTHVRLKPYREVWVGAIFAALQTKITGTNHFVGLPPTEPPDIVIGRFVPGQTPSGRTATKLEKMPTEITRCNLDANETLFDQIVKKNKPAYSNTILLIYIFGAGQEVNFQEVADQVKKLPKVYPSEIIVIGRVEKTTSGVVFEPGTFAQTKLFPDGGQDIVNVTDKQAFFREPEIMTSLKLGVSTKVEPIGSLMLLPPKID